jgi:uncharacterized protein
MGDRSAPPAQVTTDDGVAIELAWSVPGDPGAVAVITHPHPLMGGDMHNPVPAGAARGLAASGIAAVRLSFRGSGGSGGQHGGGDAERADVRATLAAAVDVVSGVPMIGMGYSFGADVLLAVDDERLAGVVAVAPPLRVLAPEVLRAPRDQRPTLVLSPAHDQFCDPARAESVTAGWPGTTVEAVPGCDHFLTGGVQRVVDRVIAFAAALG